MKGIKILLVTTILLMVAACNTKSENKISFASDCGESPIHSYVVSLSDGSVSRLIDSQYSATGVSWASDGNRIAFTGVKNLDPASTGIYVYDMSDGSTQMVIPGGGNVTPAWSPDGKKLAFSSSRWSDNEVTSEIYTLDLITGAEQKITKNMQTALEPSWSPDGKWIVFWALRGTANGNKGGSYIVDVMGENEPRYLIDGISPVWSPDGQWIAFQAYERFSDNADIFIIHPDGSELIRLTDSPARDEAPSWSPDSSLLVFTSDRSNPFEWKLYILSIKDKSVEPVVMRECSSNETDETNPIWVP